MMMAARNNISMAMTLTAIRTIVVMTMHMPLMVLVRQASSEDDHDHYMGDAGVGAVALCDENSSEDRGRPDLIRLFTVEPERAATGQGPELLKVVTPKG